MEWIKITADTRFEAGSRHCLFLRERFSSNGLIRYIDYNKGFAKGTAVRIHGEEEETSIAAWDYYALITIPEALKTRHANEHYI